jgi:hypothetical protein
MEKLLFLKLSSIRKAFVKVKKILNIALNNLRQLGVIISYGRKIGIERMLWAVETIEVEYGHYSSSTQKMCIDKHGNPIPWYTYPAIEYLKQLDFSDKEVYEYGAGNSSLFWARRAKTVTSVENDRTWHSFVKKKQAQNQEILFINDEEEYVNSIIRKQQKYDLIIIDGVARFACAQVAIHSLGKGGMIILDNSDWYPNTAKFLRESDLIQVDFTGMGPINYYNWTTSVFLQRDFYIKARSELQPEPGIGSVVYRVEPE